MVNINNVGHINDDDDDNDDDDENDDGDNDGGNDDGGNYNDDGSVHVNDDDINGVANFVIK